MIDVLLDNIIFSLQKSGGASVVWQQHLKRLLRDNTFICSVLEYDKAEENFFRNQLDVDNGIKIVKDSSFLFIKRYLNVKIRNEIKHVFHSSHYRLNLSSNAINVTTVHDFTYEFFVKGLSQRVHTWQKNNAINNSKGIICVSENTKNDLLRFLPHIDKNKIRVIYNGVDTAFRPLVNDGVFLKKHFFEDYSYVLYVGDRQSGYKNFDMAVSACALLKFPLLIVGGGELRETESLELDSKLGKGNYSILLSVSVEELNYYYNKAYCLLYPSLYEGFGIPIVEAQQSGCPVIATNTSSIPEVIGNKYLAVENPTPQRIANKLKELSFVNDLRKETIDKGFEKSKDFSWEKTYQQTIEFYKELYFEK